MLKLTYFLYYAFVVNFLAIINSLLSIDSSCKISNLDFKFSMSSSVKGYTMELYSLIKILIHTIPLSLNKSKIE